MAPDEDTRITLAATLPTASKVAVGIVDVAAVGARVLLSLQAPDGWTVVETPVDVTGLQTRPVLAAASAGCTENADTPPGASGAQHPPLVLIRSFYPTSPAAAHGETAGRATGPQPGPQVSLVILNAAVPDADQAEVATALLDFLTAAQPPSGGDQQQQAPGQDDGGSAAGADEMIPEAQAAAGGPPDSGAATRGVLYVAAGLLLQHLTNPAALFQHLLNGAAPLTSSPVPLPALATTGPTDVSGSAAAAAGPIRVRDGQLAALLHVLEASGTPACCLLAPGHKPPATTPLDLPDSAAACDVLGATLAAELGLRYEASACRAVRALYKWFIPEKSAGSDVMYL